MINNYLIMLILLILIIISIELKEKVKYNESFLLIQQPKKKYDCIISIIIHEDFQFLLKQIRNIEKNVKMSHAIILNCNDYMFEECNKQKLPDNVYINNIILNKKRYHGSLTNGIYNNMVYALKNFNFIFFIVSSSRNMFIKVSLDDLYKVTKNKLHEENHPYSEWHWPIFMNTLLAKYYISKQLKLYSSPHEGLMFLVDACHNIVSFLENNLEIKNDLFNFNHCVEEFSLQTISIHTGGLFYYIGNGCCDENEINPDDKFKFMYKVNRN